MRDSFWISSFCACCGCGANTVPGPLCPLAALRSPPLRARIPELRAPELRTAVSRPLMGESSARGAPAAADFSAAAAAAARRWAMGDSDMAGNAVAGLLLPGVGLITVALFVVATSALVEMELAARSSDAASSRISDPSPRVSVSSPKKSRNATVGDGGLVASVVVVAVVGTDFLLPVSGLPLPGTSRMKGKAGVGECEPGARGRDGPGTADLSGEGSGSERRASTL
jgi:hypothetical protein